MREAQKAHPSEQQLEYVDFGLDRLCDGCPLRQAAYEGFLPAYGVRIGTNEEKTSIDVINFEIAYEQSRGRLIDKRPTYRAVLAVGYTAVFEVEAAFEACESPVILPRKLRRNKLICSALNSVMPGKVPDGRNLRVGQPEGPSTKQKAT